MSPMTDQMLNSKYKTENLRFLRTHLGMTQKEFIERFLIREDGTPAMSVATFSNLESKGGIRLAEVLLKASEALQIDSMLFSMDPDTFARKISILLSDSADTENIGRSVARSGKIDQLLYKLTMYFAEKLMDKELKKGDKIESDRELAKKMNVGRSAIREALKVLDVLGMLDIRPGQGTYISSEEANFFIIPLSWSLFLNGSQLKDILEVRNLLEVKAAQLAAEHADDAGRRRLSLLAEKISKAYEEQEEKEFLDYEMEFHRCVAQCSGNQVIYSMLETISNLMRRLSATGMTGVHQQEEIYQENQRIYSLILAGDKEGSAEAMREHMKRSTQRYHYI